MSKVIASVNSPVGQVKLIGIDQNPCAWSDLPDFVLLGRTSTPAERMLPLYQAGYKPSFFKEQKVAEVGKDEKGVGVKAAVITYDFYVTTPAGLELLVGKSCQPSWFYNFMGDRTIDPEQFNYTWH